jgi:hypothetical protein
MDFNWGLVLQVVGYALTVIMFFVAVYLKNGKDLAKTKEVVAKMIGDALALAVVFAKKVAGEVSDKQLDEFSGGVYDFWVPRLPDGLPGLVMKYYPKQAFQTLFRKIWGEYSRRTAMLKEVVARQ